MSIEQIKNKLPEALKDTKINVEKLLANEEGHLTIKQTALIALSCAYALKNNELKNLIKQHFVQEEALVNAAKICASLMAMNNVYYRFTHLVQDKNFSSMSPMLRMSGLMAHGVHSADFELAALAVSALNGCGMCMDAHTEKLKKEAVQMASIQAAVRIAAVLNATSVGIEM